MRYFVLFYLVFLSLNGFAQNWSLIQEDNVSFYLPNETIIGELYNAHRNIISIRIDSINIDGGDSIFHFNRVLKESTECEYGYALHQPQFLQAEVKKIATDYYFSGNESFIIKSRASLAEQWNFNDTITATVAQLDTQTVFGILDSVRTISLSSGDSIQVSKHFGILRFPYIFGRSDYFYRLAGLKTPITDYGTTIANTKDIFGGLQAGDKFEYYTSLYHGSLGSASERILFVINEVSITEGKVDISVRGTSFGCSTRDDESIPEEHRSNRWRTHFSDYPVEDFIVSYLSKYSREVVQHSLSREGTRGGDLTGHPVYTRPLHGFTEYCGRTFKTRKIDYGGGSTYDTIYYSWNNRPAEGCYLPYSALASSYLYPDNYVFAEGLGIIYSRIGDVTISLKAFRIGDFQCGEFSDFFPAEEKKIDVKKDGLIETYEAFTIYPNPFSEEINVQIPGDHSISGVLEIFNTTGSRLQSIPFEGNTLQLNLSSLPRGLYLLRYRSGSTISSVERMIKW